jgi:tripartite-type tricarboxylate transporter receptor subunit TctC
MRPPFACLLALAGALLSTQVCAQEFPSKPVHVMVGAAPGGLIDLFARTYSTKLQERSGQPVLVENNSVATGTIGAGLVAKSDPDG